MATTTAKPDIEIRDPSSGKPVPAWPQNAGGEPTFAGGPAAQSAGGPAAQSSARKPSPQDALQALLAFSALHDQIRRRKALATRSHTFDSPAEGDEFEPAELFVLDEVLQLVAERAVAITGADGLAIALAENSEIVLRAAAGEVRPDVGTRIDRDSAFSGACFRTAQIINCDDTETDSRVNLDACRKMGARSMVAVPLCGRKRVIGVLEAFSAWPFAFNEIDVRNLSLLAELILGALKPEDEDRFAQSAQVAAAHLETPRTAPVKAAESTKTEGLKPAGPRIEPSKPSSIKLDPPKPASTTAVTVPVAATKIAIPTPAAPTFAPPTFATPTKQPAPAEAAKSTTVPVVTDPAATPKPSPSASGLPTPKPVAQVPKAAPNALEYKNAVAATTKPGKPVEAETSSSATSALTPSKSAGETTESRSTREVGMETGSAPEPILTFGQTQDEASNRPWLLVMLVGTVVAAVFIAGVWWKLKTAQIGSAIVQNPPQIEQPSAPASQAKASAPATAGDSPEGGDVLPADEEPGNTPATPQELSKFPRVTGVRHWSSGDSSTVVLDLEDQVQYEPGHLPNPERFYFDLRDTQLASGLEGKSLDGDALLSHIRIAQPVSGMTRVVLEARPSAALSAPQVSLERDPYRLVIQVSKAGAAPKVAVNLFPAPAEPERAKLAIVVPPPTKEDLQLRARVPKMRIVVDPGHGGWDLGTVGRRGLLEKDLVLEIAQRLGKLLESRLGAEVIYTRQDDNYIPLDDRAVIANQAQADLFISVHANYSDLPSARGVETYYTNFFSAPGSKDLPTNATPKEAAMRSMPKNVTTPSLTPGELHDRIEQSRRLAASVQRSLYGTLSMLNPGLRDRGVKEAGFVVLTESSMPGILAEVSFVSSPTDEQKLRSDGYREQIAEALYRGVARYAATSKGVKVASAAK